MTTLKEIFRVRFGAYAKERKLPKRSFQAANAIMNCRTAAMGGHVQQCENGHVVGIHYNSCRHRSCPLCNARSKTQWADGQAARLLACDHYHVIFTLPHELLDWWAYNRRLLADLLFASAAGALMSLLKDERHLGGTAGTIASLHTWGRTLSRHPHVHCLVTGGALSATGEWRAVRNGYLVALKALKPVYRGQFLSGLEQLLKRGELHLPKETSSEEASALLHTIARKEWNVRIQQRYAHGHGVMHYLARYVRGGPIGNRRLVDATQTHVRFRYRDHRDGKAKIMALGHDEFISRVLWHVPECGRHTTRHYGLYAHKARARRALCRDRLGQEPEPAKPPSVDWQSYLEQIGRGDKTRCRQCGALVRTGAPVLRGTGYPISIGQCLRIGHVQQDDEAAITRLRQGIGPPEGRVFFDGENGRLSKR